MIGWVIIHSSHAIHFLQYVNYVGTTDPADDSGKKNIDSLPTCIDELKLKNLDTGEEYIIGENDPDFEFDTFALGTRSEKESNSWFDTLWEWMFGGKNEEKESNLAPQPQKLRFTKLSDFKFRRELGRGAFGRVLLAESRMDGQLFAIKIIAKKDMRSSDVKQVIAERDILYSMAHASPHPFTTGLKFAFQSENNLYLGMEYLPGGNLRQLIQRFGCLPEDWVRIYAAELVLALSHLHSINVLYRDIKPHNVMLDATGHIILIDFGLSKRDVDHAAGAQSLVGTPDYSAPEVLKTGVFRIENEERQKQGKRLKVPSKLKGEVGYGKAADWWSLGVMIFEMLGGLPAFRGSDLRQTYQKVLYADVRFHPEENFSPASRELILGLLKRDPSQRLGSRFDSPNDIKEASFFVNVDWNAVFNRQLPSPWIPDSGYYPKKNDKKAKSASDESIAAFSEQSEVLHVRDSIICPPNKKDKNRITDWSFMDETAIAQAVMIRSTNNSSKNK